MAHASDVKGGGLCPRLYSLLLQPPGEGLNICWYRVEGGGVYESTQILQEPKLPASLLALLSTWILFLMRSCEYLPQDSI